MPAGVVETEKDERIWKQKVSEVEKSLGKTKKTFTDRDWGLVNMLFQKAKKKYAGKRLPKKYAAASFLDSLIRLSKIVQAAVPHWVTPDRGESTVLRIQNTKGQGPFAVREKWAEKEVHISPFEDQGFDSRILDMLSDAEDEGSGQFLYGFKDHAQLKRYFTPGELQKMADLGFTPKSVPADYVWFGHHQVIFTPTGLEIERIKWFPKF